VSWKFGNAPAKPPEGAAAVRCLKLCIAISCRPGTASGNDNRLAAWADARRLTVNVTRKCVIGLSTNHAHGRAKTYGAISSGVWTTLPFSDVPTISNAGGRGSGRAKASEALGLLRDTANVMSGVP
jgi:hypothetical protein